MKTEVSTYQSLNKLAKAGGYVIFGGEEDRRIPLCELKQSFDLQYDFYNRSIPGLSVENAGEYYDSCVAALSPEVIFLHIGAADTALFGRDAARFDREYRTLLQHIRETGKNCELAVVCLKNPDNDPLVAEMNRHLAVIAESEQCQFCDIGTARVWNPRETKEVLSFIYSIGFVRPLHRKRPIYDLVRMLFCSGPACIA